MDDDYDFDDRERNIVNKSRPKKRSIVNKLASNINNSNNRTRHHLDERSEEHEDDFIARGKRSSEFDKQKFENDRSSNGWRNDERKTGMLGNGVVGRTTSRSSLSNGNKDLSYENGLSRHSSERSVTNRTRNNFTNNSSSIFENDLESEVRSFRKNSLHKNNFDHTFRSSLENLDKTIGRDISEYNESKFDNNFLDSTQRNLYTSKASYSKSTTDISHKASMPQSNSSRINIEDNPSTKLSARERRRHLLSSPDYTLNSARKPGEFSQSIPNITKSENFTTTRGTLHSLSDRKIIGSQVKNLNNSFTIQSDDDINDGGRYMTSSKINISSSILAAVPTEKIRNRSYLVGSTNTGLLGSEELTRYFPNKRIRIHISTWNVCEMKTLPSNVDNLLLPKISEILFDMYIISTQETAFDRHEWCIKLQESLGPHFVMYNQASHGTLNIVIFIRRDLIWFLSAPEESTVTTRIGPSSIKTKGAVAVAFVFFGSTMVFINSHFKANEGKFEDRVEDFKKIILNLNFPKTISQKQIKNGNQFDSTSLFDHVFWMGDLNSRMEIEREKIGGAMTSSEIGLDQIEKFLEVDELKRIMTEQLAFKDFSEARIKFLPTYKFDIGTDNYDTSYKNRKPSYTDRILYRCKKKSTISCLHYNSVMSFQQSDHKPVYGVFEAELRPGLDDVMLSGGQFNRDIWIEGTKRRAAQQLVKQHVTEKSAVCRVM